MKGPYWCSQGNYSIAVGPCMNNPQNIDVTQLTTKTDLYASQGEIDLTSNMLNDRVYIFAGELDTVVNPGAGQKAIQYYLSYVKQENIMSVFNIPAQHTFPTVDYGNECNQSRSPWLSRCNYNLASIMLAHFYDNLVPSDGNVGVDLPGQFYEFDQSEFFTLESPPSAASMDDIGFVYVPSGCVSSENACKLHVAIHGCNQQRDRIGDEFARNAGYNEVGELNNIIVVYPQTIASLVTPVNPSACWDWWGYTIDDFATKKADQMAAIWKMVEKVAY